ncbi:hypothetical protein BD626DRAFT_543763 [Schizophyllum amplum]|uniref:Uncharacterized protein n=1 Tax=Schizophyllum amplum TaxID=97359 RepID=A0A550BRH3_9AGAR|nr:hypothetical protein BD626DRAFT_543763 [Auriculariopsis ampla]
MSLSNHPEHDDEDDCDNDACSHIVLSPKMRLSLGWEAKLRMPRPQFLYANIKRQKYCNDKKCPMLRTVRHPEVICDFSRVQRAKVHGSITEPAGRFRPRVVDIRKGDLCIKVDEDGTRCFVLPPMQWNAIWCRFFVWDIDKRNGTGTDICFEGEDECGAEVPRRWSPAHMEYVRLCGQCFTIWHVLCLETHGKQVNLLDDFEKQTIMENEQHAHLRYLFSDEVTKRPMPAFNNFGFGKSLLKNFDIDDEMQAYSVPEGVTWDEIAALPLKRKSFAGMAPASLEMVITEARKQRKATKAARAGKGREGAPIPKSFEQWLDELKDDRNASIRAVKIMLTSHLRVLRSKGLPGQRWFRCPSCNAYI